MKTRQIILLAMTILITGVQATALTCKAQLVHSACGSGKVEITLDSENNIFLLHNGDVPCWNMDLKKHGQIEKVQTKYPYFVAETFELKLHASPEIYATLLYDSETQVARLEIMNKDLNYPTLSSKYDLVCN
jgi:hypothetical protein